jgi:hypothetical protein
MIELPCTLVPTRKAVTMKVSRSDVHTKARTLPELHADEQQLTSAAGLLADPPGRSRGQGIPRFTLTDRGDNLACIPTEFQMTPGADQFSEG